VILTTFRLAAYETPLWALENFSPGRYNAAGDGATQYLSLHPMTPWAELLRQQRRRTADAALQLRLPMWAIKVGLAKAPTEIGFAEAAACGISADDLVADDQTACREFARRVRSDPDAPRAILVPSAALPGTPNLVLLDPFVAISYLAEPIAPEDLPTSMAAQEGRCPDGLWDLVHHSGSPNVHAALDAWHRGDQYAFAEPPVVASAQDLHLG
jgi:RES domain-containing protein